MTRLQYFPRVLNAEEFGQSKRSKKKKNGFVGKPNFVQNALKSYVPWLRYRCGTEAESLHLDCDGDWAEHSLRQQTRGLPCHFVFVSPIISCSRRSSSDAEARASRIALSGLASRLSNNTTNNNDYVEASHTPRRCSRGHRLGVLSQRLQRPRVVRD